MTGIILFAISISYLDVFITGTLGLVVFNLLNYMHPKIKNYFSVLTGMILENFKRSGLFIFQIVTVLITVHFIPASSRGLKFCLLWWGKYQFGPGKQRGYIM